MNDLISRAEAIDAPEKFIKDCNPDHFVGHQKFIEYMDNAEIGSFGKWQFANGFNMGLTAAEVAIKKLPSAQPESEEFEWCTDCKEYDQTAHCCHRWTKVIRRTVAEIKAEQPEPKWIPCYEALPEKDGLYLTCNAWNGLEVTYWFNGIGDDYYGWDDHGDGLPPFDKIEGRYLIKAWMPLPEPYEEVKDETD